MTEPSELERIIFARADAELKQSIDAQLKPLMERFELLRAAYPKEASGQVPTNGGASVHWWGEDVVKLFNAAFAAMRDGNRMKAVREFMARVEKLGAEVAELKEQIQAQGAVTT